ncbi:MAG: adenosylcobinamide-phosphate synthase CbiB [Alphaproteobacteria bacterium]|nr:adenosylcobinamide-phosphate synthase CbiB [Alphaproteobacteria bacterium]
MLATGPLGIGGSGANDALILLLALFIEAIVGDLRILFRVIPHPVAAFGRLVGALDRRLNREIRSERNRILRGAVVVIVLILLVASLGWAVHLFVREVPFGEALELAVLVILIAQRGLFDHVKRVGAALREDGIDAGRAAVGHIVGRDVKGLDEHGVCRAAIESCAENFNDGVLAPVFWYVLLGLPGLMMYKAVNTMDSMIGFTTPRHRAFGMAAARLDDALNFFPARISGHVIALAALFVPTANAARAVKVMWSDAGKHRSLNAGWPEGAMAGALDLALGGPRSYEGEVVPDPWIGGGRARANHRDIRRALYMFTVACLINAGLVAGLILLHLSA